MPITETEHKVKIDVKLTPAHDGQVTVHCHYHTSSEEECIRIWDSTFLKAVGESHASTLVHAEGITMFPKWLVIPPHTKHVFTLIFTPMPKSISLFDLIEEIPQSGGFVVRNIQRNKTDVYRVSL